MDKADLKLTFLDGSNHVVTKTISYVNPNVPDSKLYQLAQKIAELTTNTLTTVTKVVTTGIDSMEVTVNG